MPYIPELVRENYDLGFAIHDAGTLTYVLVKATLRYMEGEPRSFETYAKAIGAIECAKAELYRRLVAPYEDIKREQNGDVF